MRIVVPVFNYKALDSQLNVLGGVIDSDSPGQARQKLRSQGMRVTEIEAVFPKSKYSFQFRQFFQRSYNHWVASFASELATLLSVGVPLLDALTTLITQYRGSHVPIVMHLKDEVASGTPLAQAMSRQPAVFDALCIKMVEVGESTGNLDGILRQLADFKKRSLEFKDRVISALLYPMVILSVSFAVSIFLMTVVVPMLLENLEDTGRTLPLPTRILKSVSDGLLDHGWIVAIAGIAGLVGIVLGLQTEYGKRLRDKLLLRLPVIGTMSRKQELAKISLVVATLMRSGIEFVKAIEIGMGTTRNVLLTEALNDCARQVSAGRNIGEALEKWSYFPPLVTQVFTVGQESGRLEEMLFQLSADYDGQVESISGRLSTIIEPVLILGLSGFVGFIMFATLMPILEAGNVL